MASISSTGIGSGLDINSIVSQMMSIERRPLNLVQQAKSGLDTKLSAMGSLQSRMSALLDASKALTTDPLWSQTLATSSNTAAVKATAGVDAPEATYGVQVNNLASRQTVVSDALSEPSIQMKGVSMVIEFGRWDDSVGPGGFVPKDGSNPLTIDLTQIPGQPGGIFNKSMSDIRDAINSAQGGVSASVINDASGYRMALSSTETGADNAFRIQIINALGQTQDNALLNYDAAQPTSRGMTRTQIAANAQATINGISIQSSTNTISSTMLAGIADGLTLNLSRVTSEEVEVKVGPDRAGIKKAIETFVNAYNDVNQYIGEQTAYKPETRKGGALQGDPMVNTLLKRMREILGYQKGGDDRSISDIGISFSNNGSLSINDTKLTSYLDSDLSLVKDLIRKDGARASRNGAAQKMFDFATSVLDSEGMFANRTSSLKGQITQNERRQDSMDRRLSQTEERMRRQYQALDATMSSLGGTSNYLMQQFSLLSGTSRNR